MSSELMEALRERVDAIVGPHVDIYGPEAPTVRMALRVLAEAEELDRVLSERRVGTPEASDRTGWSVDTLQRHARAKLTGEEVPEPWSRLVVAGPPYVFVLDTIPPKPSAAA